MAQHRDGGRCVCRFSSPYLTASKRARVGEEKVSLRYDHPLELLRGTGTSTYREQEHYTSVLMARRACNAFALKVASFNAKVRAGATVSKAGNSGNSRSMSSRVGIESARAQGTGMDSLTVTINGIKPHPHGALASRLSAWLAMNTGSNTRNTIGGSISDRILLNYLLSRDETAVRAWGGWRAHYHATRGGHYGRDRGQYLTTMARTGAPSSTENTATASCDTASVDQTIIEQARRLGALRKAKVEAGGDSNAPIDVPLESVNGHETSAAATFHLSTMLNSNGTSFVSVNGIHETTHATNAATGDVGKGAAGVVGPEVATLTKETAKLVKLMILALPMPTVAQVASQEEEEENENENEDDDDGDYVKARNTHKVRAYHRYRPHNLQYLHKQQQRHILSHALGASSGADVDRGVHGLNEAPAKSLASSSARARANLTFKSKLESKSTSKVAWKEQTVLMGDVLEEWCGRVSKSDVEEKASLRGNTINLLASGYSNANDNSVNSRRLNPGSTLPDYGKELSLSASDGAAFFTKPRKSRAPVSTNPAIIAAPPAEIRHLSQPSGSTLGVPSSSTDFDVEKAPNQTALLVPPPSAPVPSAQARKTKGINEEALQPLPSVNSPVASVNIPKSDSVTSPSSTHVVSKAETPEPESPTSPVRSVRVVQPNTRRQYSSSGTRISSGAGLLSAPKRNKFISKSTQ